MANHGFSTAAVLGTGMMGPGIAAVLAIGGVQATLVICSQEGATQGLEQGLARIEIRKTNKLPDNELAAEAANIEMMIMTQKHSVDRNEFDARDCWRACRVRR
jgi:3-hydroxyacyl-CoA dehydrogenase